MKIAIIGAGNMGGSIARGLAKGSLIEDSDIIVSNPSAGKLEQLKKEFPNISLGTVYRITRKRQRERTSLSSP